MSEFKDENFVNEFAYRTKLNYFYQKERFAKNEKIREQASREIDRTKYIMIGRNFDIAEYYEVTDLINSLIGLLIFPESNVFDYIPKYERNLKEKFPQLYKCKQYDRKFLNDAPPIIRYRSAVDEKYKTMEKNSPRDICRHLRNSLCHWRVMIEPHSASIGEGQRQIVSIQFQDEGKCRDEHGRWHDVKFSLTIKVEDLEDVVMEICDYLINMKG